VKRAISSSSDAVFHLGQAHQHERQERSLVPLVVQQNVQVVERVLMKQVGFIEEKHGVCSLFAEVLDMLRDGEEHRRCCG
jgi:hypothetical protein